MYLTDTYIAIAIAQYKAINGIHTSFVSIQVTVSLRLSCETIEEVMLDVDTEPAGVVAPAAVLHRLREESSGNTGRLLA